MGVLKIPVDKSKLCPIFTVDVSNPLTSLSPIQLPVPEFFIAVNITVSDLDKGMRISNFGKFQKYLKNKAKEKI